MSTSTNFLSRNVKIVIKNLKKYKVKIGMIDFLYHFLFSSFKNIDCMCKTGEQRVKQEPFMIITTQLRIKINLI